MKFIVFASIERFLINKNLSIEEGYLKSYIY